MFGGVRGRLRDRFRASKKMIGARFLERVVRSGGPVKSSLNHDLPGELIVSLTSYPARFPALALTLTCLLRQTMRADRIILWLGVGDALRLPAEVRALQAHGLEIRETMDLRAYTKLIPALQSFPEAYVVTADDDLFYPKGWLAALVDTFDRASPEIICHRAHMPTFNADGSLGPYRRWRWEARCPEGSAVLFPTGVGGVLYAPGLLSPQVTDVATFKDICPYNDDVWLYFMGRKVGTRYRTVRKYFQIYDWPDTQQHGLMAHNVDGGENDRQIRRLEERFGVLAA